MWAVRMMDVYMINGRRKQGNETEFIGVNESGMEIRGEPVNLS